MASNGCQSGLEGLNGPQKVSKGLRLMISDVEAGSFITPLTQLNWPSAPLVGPQIPLAEHHTPLADPHTPLASPRTPQG